MGGGQGSDCRQVGGETGGAQEALLQQEKRREGKKGRMGTAYGIKERFEDGRRREGRGGGYVEESSICVRSEMRDQRCHRF